MPEFRGDSPHAVADPELLAQHTSGLYRTHRRDRAAAVDQDLDDVPVDMLADPAATRAAIARRRQRRAAGASLPQEGASPMT